MRPTSGVKTPPLNMSDVPRSPGSSTSPSSAAAMASSRARADIPPSSSRGVSGSAAMRVDVWARRMGTLLVYIRRDVFATRPTQRRQGARAGAGARLAAARVDIVTAKAHSCRDHTRFARRAVDARAEC